MVVVRRGAGAVQLARTLCGVSSRQIYRTLLEAAPKQR